MKKEIIICITIILLIIIGNYITVNYETYVVKIMTEKLEEVKYNIQLENIDENELNDKLNNLNQEWNNTHSKMAYFAEHDELEKVETNLTSLTSLCKTKEYSKAINEIDKNIFILEHLKERNEFKLENIF